MKDLIRQYLGSGLSRRQLMRGLGAAGLSTAAAKSVIESLGPTPAQAQAAGSDAIRKVTGTGGMLYIQQLKSAGVEYIFFNPSTGDAPFYDAVVDVPEIQLIKGIQEGAVVAMADGYARLSGKVAVAQIANVGLPNGMTQLVNSWKDRIPVLLTVAAFGTETAGRDYGQDYDHQEPMLSPITKWFWMAENTAGIADVTRRALKFATTPPTGPVFLSIPDDLLRARATAEVYDRKLFSVAMKIRPDQHDVEAIAKQLIEAANPLISVGDEITQCQAEQEVVELADLLGIPVAQGDQFGGLASWSKPFPTRHPLFIGKFAQKMRFPGVVDVHFNIGDQTSERHDAGRDHDFDAPRPDRARARMAGEYADCVRYQTRHRRRRRRRQEHGDQGATAADRRAARQARPGLHCRHGGDAPDHRRRSKSRHIDHHGAIGG